MTDYPPTYSDAIIEITPRDSSVIVADLRRELDDDLAARLRGLFGTGFAIITAQDPYGRKTGDGVNEKRAIALEKQLEEAGTPFVRADGRSPDGTHCERGVAAAMSLGAARALARDQQQIALYWFDCAAFWLEGALLDAAPLRLPAGDPLRGDPPLD